MEQNRTIGEKVGSSNLASATQFGYSTESHPAHSPSLFAKVRTRRRLMWGLVSTILSAMGLIGLALFEQYNGTLSELRADLKHFNEASSEYVKKDKLQKCWEHVRECAKEITASNEARAHLEEELKASQKVRERLLEEIQRLRERVAYVEGLKGARPSVEPARYMTLEAEDTSQR
jgi:hypothetical protein